MLDFAMFSLQKIIIMESDMGIVPGPIDDSVLYEQPRHVSQKIWVDEFDFKIQARNGTHFSETEDLRILEQFVGAGLYRLYQLYPLKIDWGLIEALVKRWRPETRNFHFLPGELTVTLQDMEVLAGVCVDGHPVMYDNSQETSLVRADIVERLLGVRPPETHIKSDSVRFTWLRANFGHNLTANATQLQLEQYARAQMLLLLGSNFLSDKSGSHCPLHFLACLEDFEVCRELSWGSAILACLYSNLYRASLVEQNQLTNNSLIIVGPLIILQVWAWSSLTQICPIRNLVEVPEGNPMWRTYGYRLAKAERHYTTDTAQWNRKWYREQFDSMHDDQVIWEPYPIDWLNALPPICQPGNAVWLTRSPLLYFNCVEYHYPDRVKRQFGMRQDVVQTPPDIGSAHTRRNDNQNWPTRHGRFVGYWNNRTGRRIQGVLHGGFMPVDNDYMSWYKSITCVRIGKPEAQPPPRGFQAMSGKIERMGFVMDEMYRMYRKGTFDPAFMQRLTDEYYPALGRPIPEPDEEDEQASPEPSNQDQFGARTSGYRYNNTNWFG